LSETVEVGLVARSMQTGRRRANLLAERSAGEMGLHWVDGEANILWANKADYGPLGYTEDEYVGHNITEFHADADVINDILERLLSGQSLYNGPGT
jgi:hypothetical protein